ncbi:MAG TPA: hypothetical protein DEH78_13390, partial [Solibacterales bacterium]|nr:hypothetical protein [Bryobacterales bacterium]
EIRFVSTVVDARTVNLNAPLTVLPTPGSPFSTTMTYRPGSGLKGVSVYDCWSPGAAVQRVLSGCALDQMRIKVNSDFHEFEFSGPAKDVIDSSSFESGQGGLTSFPTEPALGQAEYSLIPGSLGQAWLGGAPTRHYTLTAAEITVHNDVDLRSHEFGFEGPRCIVPGQRTVGIRFSLYEQGGDSTKELYQAARQRSPVSVMLQLGEQPGHMFGVYMANVVPEVPEFDDGDRRLQWQFSLSRAQGSVDDEISVAFG